MLFSHFPSFAWSVHFPVFFFLLCTHPSPFYYLTCPNHRNCTCCMVLASITNSFLHNSFLIRCLLVYSVLFSLLFCLSLIVHDSYVQLLILLVFDHFCSHVLRIPFLFRTHLVFHIFLYHSTEFYLPERHRNVNEAGMELDYLGLPRVKEETGI